ncbi:chitinase N-terminal domain-containing protein [Motilimonas sp. E26]|uniref:chitinase N-terminal domain-containing protein n=1 Tax=Motilimonas sp. E26 TaxID=2865674 RepID=UPI001E3351AE|nr:chitinase N-terminal domain-containing protein [Motilimonas sp. E26]MCE0558050.1 polysaccharide deacetylase family protein [Motilimonas sp. E26]
MAKLTYLAGLMTILCGTAVAAPSPAQLDVLPTKTSVYETHTVSWNMWWGENAQQWRLLNNGEEICSGELVAKGSSKQSASCQTQFLPGENLLKVSLCNVNGCSDSATHQVIAEEPELLAWQAETPYPAGSFILVGKKIYQAQWWTKNEQPPAKVWAFITEQGAALSAQVATWKDNAQAAYTIQHDDLCGYITDGIIHNGVPELEARGLQGSVGVIAGNCADYHWQAVEKFAAAGHEIFNHSWMHVSPVGDTWSDEVEISQAQKKIEQYAPAAVEFYAFPEDQATPASIAALKAEPNLIGMRSVNYWQARGVNDANTFDPYFIKNDLFTNSGIWSVYEGSDDILRAYVDDAIAKGGWALRTFHGVEDTSWEMVPLARYQGHLDYVKSLVDDGKLWVAGASDIIRYGMSRRSCTTQADTQYNGNLVVSFDLSDAQCQKYLADETELTLVINTDQDVLGVSASYLVAPADEAQPSVTAVSATQYLVNVKPHLGQVILVAK